MNITANDIEYIKEMLPMLSKPALHETRDFIQYLLEKQKKRKAFVERIRKAEENPDSIICNSVEEAMQAIYNTPDDDDEA